MLTYTFSTREKIMLGVLGLVVVFIAWYQLIYSNIQSQIISLDTEIATVQDEFAATQTRVASYSEMRSAIEKFKAQGLEPVTVPTFDNTQNLMAYLNGVLQSSNNYSMSFDTPYLSDSDQSMHREGSIQFDTSNYESARSVTEAIARGIYPCRVKALAISESNRRNSSNVVSNYTASMEVTFVENPNGKETATESEDEIPEGNDWSVMKEVL